MACSYRGFRLQAGNQCFGAWTNLVFFMSAGTFRGKCLIEGDGVVHREFVA